MRHIHLGLLGLLTSLFLCSCAAEDASPPIPTFNFDFGEEDTSSDDEENGGEEGGDQEETTSQDVTGGDVDLNPNGDGEVLDGDILETEADSDTTQEGDENGDQPDGGNTEDKDTGETTGGGTTEGGENTTGGEEVDLCSVVDPPQATKMGVCKGTLVCDCVDGEYNCNYGIVPNHELFETSCDGLDNDCDGSTDEGLVNINDSSCPNLGVCTNTLFAFCHMGNWYCDYGLAPSFEFSETLCDGLDNDCDGQTDESVAFDSISCKTEGVCAGNAQPKCENGGIVCDYSGAGILYEEEETLCDNQDNDCDGETDEIELTGLTEEDIPVDCNPNSPQDGPCCLGSGICSGKTNASCSAGSWTCSYDAVDGFQGDGESLCDGLDNDCDGETDEAENLDPLTSECSFTGVCSSSAPTCNQDTGLWNCNLNQLDGYEPDNELSCDNIDNDCDGETDEGITDIQGPETTLCPDEGICSLGVTTKCDAGVWVCDFDLLEDYEAVELSCDTQDNDCDGLTDEELTSPSGEAEGCEQFGQGVCTQFVALACENGVFSCSYDNVPLYQEEETACDGLDNDCDGETDELLNDPLTSECLNVGVCEVGVVASCQNQQWFCFYSNVQGYETEEVTCDGLDNDCDGQTDEGLYDLDNSSCKQEGVCSTGVQAGCVSGEWLCDYSQVASYSGEDEYVCDGLDNNCDGTADEYVCATTEPCTEDIQCFGNKCRATPGGGDSFCTEGTQCVQPMLTQEGVELVASGTTACLNPSTYQTCVAGTWTNTISCPTETPVCSDGTCLICSPSSLDCQDAENRVSCGVEGEGFEPVGSCSSGQICVGGGYCTTATSAAAGGMNIIGDQESPFIIKYPDDSVLVGWTDLSGADGDGAGIYDRKFIQNGTPQGVESAVSTVNSGDQKKATGVTLDDESFLIWMDYSQGENARILGRRVTNIGDPSSPIVDISPIDSQHHANPRVTRLESGNIAVVWEAGPTSVSQNTDIFGRLFDENGVALTGTFSINAVKTGQQTKPDVVSLIDGRFIVVWESHDSGNGQIVFQRFKSDGTKQGSQITVNQQAEGDQTHPRAAVLSDGRIAFLFLTDGGNEGDDRSLRLRMFNSGGLGDGPGVTIADSVLGDQSDPVITAVSNQGFAVGSTTLSASGNGLGTIRMYRYDLNKSQVGNTIVIAEDGESEVEFSGNQGELAMVGTKDNRIVVVYTNQTSGEVPQKEVRIQVMEFDYGIIELID